MSDPTDLLDEIAAAEDAFSHANGRPRFEPDLNSRADTEEGEVQIQKACRGCHTAGRILVVRFLNLLGTGQDRIAASAVNR